MCWLFECKCGQKVGLQVKAIWVLCQCGKRMKGKEMDRDTYRKLFTTKVRRKAASA